MAKATHAVRHTERVVVDKEDVVVLELSHKEAQALAEALAAVGGAPEKSGRKHTDAISRALHGTGFYYSWNRDLNSNPVTHGSVYFNEGMGL